MHFIREKKIKTLFFVRLELKLHFSLLRVAASVTFTAYLFLKVIKNIQCIEILCIWRAAQTMITVDYVLWR